MLTTEGATVTEHHDGSRTVTGLTAARVGQLAFDHRIMLHEVTTHAASLEEAFMELTADSVEYLAGEQR
ncbi:hypothetical protein AAH979_36395 [Plantactinospora sp. ZYX-F-223]|uniref:hypothetical protein n=1 Tax=Plantactinospora sp. ZYX-F-223 TaxID=3144103 RepID=UPI0031FC2109